MGLRFICQCWSDVWDLPRVWQLQYEPSYRMTYASVGHLELECTSMQTMPFGARQCLCLDVWSALWPGLCLMCSSLATRQWLAGGAYVTSLAQEVN